jgi:cytochrome b561
MQWRNSENKFGLVTRSLHVLIALTIIGQIVLGFFMNAPILYFIHKSLGLTLLFLAVLFVIWLCIDRHPGYPKMMPTWEKLAAIVERYLLVIFILVMPISGWMMSSAAGRAPSFWGWFTLNAPVPLSKNLAGFMSDIHTISAWILAGLIAIHILAALKHALLDKDGILRRMF